jgi:hypothetical protein
MRCQAPRPQYCVHGYHRQEDLAMFGYRTAMKVEIIFKNLYLGYLPEQCVETWKFFRFFMNFW